MELLMVEGKFGVCNGIIWVNDVKFGWVILGLMLLIVCFYKIIRWCYVFSFVLNDKLL